MCSAVAQGSNHRHAARAYNAPDLGTSSFGPVAPRLWQMAKLGPKDVDVLQSYENFTGGVLMSLTEHGYFKPEEANEFLTLENLLAPTGKLPLNTSGGNLAECYMHGLELQIEAIRQIRGTSTSQVPSAKVAGVIAGPMVTPVSTMIVRLRGDAVMSYLPKGLPEPVTESDKLDLPYWQGTRAGQADGAALRRLPGVAMGAGMALPQVSFVRHEVGRGRGQGTDLLVDPLLASRAPRAEGLRALHRRRGRAARRRQHPHARQPRSAIRSRRSRSVPPSRPCSSRTTTPRLPYTLVQWKRA